MNPVKPLGHYVLIEIIPVQFKSAGGIIMSTEKESERERKGRDLGRIKEFGPTAYKGFAGCESSEDWGVSIGDVVELKGRYDGKFSSVVDYSDKYKNLRYVSDSDIIGIFSEEMTQQLINEDKL
jgi:co-chaperonin GroES (HSP10)